MAELKANCIQDLTLVECPICTDALTDPRVLPCGHSYCGPPKNCLQGVQQQTQDPALKCAVCQEEFNLQVSQLKPLYGIRDFLEQTTLQARRSENEGSFEVLCEEHVGNAVMFWCKSCTKKACKECFDSEHESHDLISFRKYLKQKVQPLYVNLLNRTENIQKRSVKIIKNLEAKKKDLEKIDADMDQIFASLEHVQIFQYQYEDIYNFIENDKHKTNLNKIESFIEELSDSQLDRFEEKLKRIDLRNHTNFNSRVEVDVNFDQETLTELLRVNYRDFEIKLLVSPNFSDDGSHVLDVDFDVVISKPRGDQTDECLYEGRVFINFPEQEKEALWFIEGKVKGITKSIKKGGFGLINPIKGMLLVIINIGLNFFESL